MTMTTTRTKSLIGTSTLTLTFVDGEKVIYSVGDLNQEVRDQLSLRALRTLLVAGRSFADIASGKIDQRGAKPSAPRAPKLNDWQMAYAHTLATAAAKEAGLKASPGKGLHAMPAYAEHLEEAKVAAAALDRKQINKVKIDPAALAHYLRITAAA